MVVTVSVIFAMCWMSGGITYLVAFFSPSFGAGDVEYVTQSTVTMFNSAVNPIVFALINQQFSKKIKFMMCYPCRKRMINGVHPIREDQSMEDFSKTLPPVQETEETPL